MIHRGGTVTLDLEVEFFEANRGEWLKHHKGKFALVRGRDLIGTFTTFQEAYEEGVDQFGSEAFLVKQVVEEDRSEHLPALTLGLIHAHP